jgi:hypothetical protein
MPECFWTMLLDHVALLDVYTFDVAFPTEHHI